MKNMSKDVNSNQYVFCWRCGRIMYENIKTGRTGCRNSRCLGYMLGSKHLGNDVLRPIRH